MSEIRYHLVLLSYIYTKYMLLIWCFPYGFRVNSVVELVSLKKFYCCRIGRIWTRSNLCQISIAFFGHSWIIPFLLRSLRNVIFFYKEHLLRVKRKGKASQLLLNTLAKVSSQITRDITTLLGIVQLRTKLAA